MKRNFEIVDGIYLVQGGQQLDLHNDFDFQGLKYSLTERKLLLNWQQSAGEWAKSVSAERVSVEFRGHLHTDEFKRGFQLEMLQRLYWFFG